MAGVAFPRCTIIVGQDRRVGLAWMAHGRVIPLIRKTVVEDNLQILPPFLIISSPHKLSLHYD